MRELKQSTAANLAVFMTSGTDHVSGATGLTLAIAVSKDAGAFASITPTVTELANGWYKLALTTGHTDTLGDLAIHVTAPGADPTDFVSRIIAIDKGNATSLGLANLDATVSSRSTYAGADTGGTTTLLTRIPGTVQPQTGDAYGRIGANGAGLTAIGDTRLANLDAAVSTRSTYAGGDTAGTTTLLGRLTGPRATNLDNLDAAVSTRSTYAGGDSAGVTTLVALLTAPRAALLDNLTRLDAAVSTVATGGIGAGDIAEGVLTAVVVNTTTFRDAIRAIAAVSCGSLAESPDRTTSTFADINDPGTPRVESINTATARNATVH
jgi:ABC-type uncharacterized transport system YnjBCD ATPase subunit